MDEKGYCEYCTGCGLCHSKYGVAFAENAKSFPVAALKEKDIPFCEKVCPSSAATDKYLQESFYNRKIRKKGV